jgi:hypothetical protein
VFHDDEVEDISPPPEVETEILSKRKRKESPLVKKGSPGTLRIQKTEFSSQVSSNPNLNQPPVSKSTSLPGKSL